MAKRMAFPLGFVATLLNATLYYHSGLFADSSLELIYSVSMIYGWYQWSYGGEDGGELGISHISRSMLLSLLGIALLATGLLTFLLQTHTPSTFPLRDALTTVLSLSATFLTCKKIIEGWFVWCVVDALYTELYFQAGLSFHVVLFGLYVGLALVGWWRWKRMMVQPVVHESAAVVSL